METFYENLQDAFFLIIKVLAICVIIRAIAYFLGYDFYVPYVDDFIRTVLYVFQ